MLTSSRYYQPSRALKLTRFFFVLGGAIFGAVFTFFIAGALLLTILGHPIPAGPLGNAFLMGSFVGGPLIGGSVGYLIFKKSKYSNPELYNSY